MGCRRWRIANSTSQGWWWPLCTLDIVDSAIAIGSCAKHMPCRCYDGVALWRGCHGARKDARCDFELVVVAIGGPERPDGGVEGLGAAGGL